MLKIIIAIIFSLLLIGNINSEKKFIKIDPTTSTKIVITPTPKPGHHFIIILDDPTTKTIKSHRFMQIPDISTTKTIELKKR